MKKVLEARIVRKTFEEGSQPVEVLRGVSLDVSAGEIVSLEGPSGSGKTTLLSMMGCILTPSAGEIHIGGERISGDENALRDAVRLRNESSKLAAMRTDPVAAVERLQHAAPSA